jgi:hypothetical protein
VSLDALDGHRMVGLRRLSSGDLVPLEFTTGDAVRSVIFPATMTMSGYRTRKLSRRRAAWPGS